MKPAMSWSEYQQLELIPPSVRQSPSWRDYLRHFYQQAITFFCPDRVKVWLTHDETEIFWNAIDHQTGRSILQVSKDELCIWIEQLHLH